MFGWYKDNVYAIFALQTQDNMPFVKSGLDFVADRLDFECHFYVKYHLFQKFKIRNKYLSLILPPPYSHTATKHNWSNEMINVKQNSIWCTIQLTEFHMVIDLTKETFCIFTSIKDKKQAIAQHSPQRIHRINKRKETLKIPMK